MELYNQLAEQYEEYLKQSAFMGRPAAATQMKAISPAPGPSEHLQWQQAGTKRSHPFFSRLPSELRRHILAYLSPARVTILRRVCQEFNELIDDCEDDLARPLISYHHHRLQPAIDKANTTGRPTFVDTKPLMDWPRDDRNHWLLTPLANIHNSSLLFTLHPSFPQDFMCGNLDLPPLPESDIICYYLHDDGNEGGAGGMDGDSGLTCMDKRGSKELKCVKWVLDELLSCMPQKKFLDPLFKAAVLGYVHIYPSGNME